MSRYRMASTNSYSEESIDAVYNSRRKNLWELSTLYIVGWAEKTRGGWIGVVRDDTGSVVRTACTRPRESEAIHAARSLVAMLRTEQIWKRKIFTDAYPNLWARTTARLAAAA